MSRRFASYAFLAACLGGCATPTPPVEEAVRPVAAAPRPVTTRSDELLGYFATVARLGGGEQRKELAQAGDAFSHGATPYARVKLGGLYAQVSPALRDDARALAILEPLAAYPKEIPPSERPIADLAFLLYAQVAERQRLLKDEAKKQEALRERIEAMKAIDRSIMRREERQGAR